MEVCIQLLEPMMMETRRSISFVFTVIFGIITEEEGKDFLLKRQKSLAAVIELLIVSPRTRRFD